MRPFCIHTRLPGFSRHATFLIDLDEVLSMAIAWSSEGGGSAETPRLDFTWQSGCVEIEVSSEEEAESILAEAVKAWTVAKGAWNSGAAATPPAMISGRVPDFLKGDA